MNIGTVLKTSLRQISNAFRKHAPEILVTAGAVGAVSAAVLACVETTKVPDILDEGNQALDKAKEKPMTEETKKEIALIKLKTAGRLVINYAPSAVLMGVSLVSIFGGHKILKKRHLATAAALIETTSNFDKYRERIKEKYGEEIEKKLFLGEHNEKVEETVTDPDTGKEKTRKVTQTVLGDNISYGYSITLNRYNCYNYSNDWDSWFNTMLFREDDLNKLVETDALITGESFLRLETILWQLGVKNVTLDDIKDFKSAGVYYNPKLHPMRVDIGLDRAKRLNDYNKVDESEMELLIKIVPDIWACADAVKKGDKNEH